MTYTTPLSRLADKLNVKRCTMNHSTIIDTTATAASHRIEQLEHKLSSTIAAAIAMAQELQEIIDDANDAGSTLPVTSEIVDLWEAIYAEQKLIDEIVAL